MARLGRSFPIQPHFKRVLRYPQTFTSIPTEAITVSDTLTSLRVKVGTFLEVLWNLDIIKNLTTNPSFEVDTTSWSSFGVGGTFAAGISRDATTAYSGAASLKIIGSGVGGSFLGAQYTATGLVVGGRYTFSFYAKGTLGTENITAAVDTGDSSSATITTSFARYSVSFTATATSHVVKAETSTAAAIYWVDAVQIEFGSPASAYFDGSLTGYSWEGTAHASISDYQTGFDFTLAHAFVEAITVSDTLIKTATRAFSEAITATDTFVGSIVHTFTTTEAFTVSDTFVRTLTRTLTESITATGSMLRNETVVLSEAITNSDTLVRVWTAVRTFTETITVSAKLFVNGTDVLWMRIQKSAAAVWSHITRN